MIPENDLFPHGFSDARNSDICSEFHLEPMEVQPAGQGVTSVYQPNVQSRVELASRNIGYASAVATDALASDLVYIATSNGLNYRGPSSQPALTGLSTRALEKARETGVDIEDLNESATQARASGALILKAATAHLEELRGIDGNPLHPSRTSGADALPFRAIAAIGMRFTNDKNEFDPGARPGARAHSSQPKRQKLARSRSEPRPSDTRGLSDTEPRQSRSPHSSERSRSVDDDRGQVRDVRDLEDEETLFRVMSRVPNRRGRRAPSPGRQSLRLATTGTSALSADYDRQFGTCDLDKASINTFDADDVRITNPRALRQGLPPVPLRYLLVRNPGRRQ